MQRRVRNKSTLQGLKVSDSTSGPEKPRPLMIDHRSRAAADLSQFNISLLITTTLLEKDPKPHDIQVPLESWRGSNTRTCRISLRLLLTKFNSVKSGKVRFLMFTIFETSTFLQMPRPRPALESLHLSSLRQLWQVSWQDTCPCTLYPVPEPNERPSPQYTTFHHRLVSNLPMRVCIPTVLDSNSSSHN